jgi:23S rRNA pseudouridine2605 synthase
MRLNRYLAASGVASRRKAEKLIEAGRVVMNGRKVTDLATFVNPETDQVEVDGKPVRPPLRRMYLLLHKPVGFLSTASDPQGRPTVMRLVPRTPRVFPVGRLDMDTSGAILFTDDGDLAHRLLHPRYKIEKEYRVRVEGALSEDTLTTLRRGLLLSGERRRTAPARVEVLEQTAQHTWLIMVIREGRKRQIRRMLDTVGHPVLELSRVRIGPISLGDLSPGTWRELTRDEVRALRRLVQDGSEGAARQ